MSKTGKIVCTIVGVYVALCAIGGIMAYKQKKDMDKFEAELASKGLHMEPHKEEEESEDENKFDLEAEMAKLRAMTE